MLPVLNTRESFTLNLKQRGGETHRIVVRWPNDEEWAKRDTARTSSMKLLGKDGVEMSNEDMDRADRVDLELFKKIHLEGEYTEDDALYTIDLLSSGSVVESEEDDNYTVELKVFGVKGVPAITVRHHMQEPGYRLVRRWRASGSTTRVKGKQYKVLVDLHFSSSMYEALVQGCEGYDGPVPILHKHAVVQEVFRRLARAEAQDADGAEDLDPAGF